MTGSTPVGAITSRVTAMAGEPCLRVIRRSGPTRFAAPTGRGAGLEAPAGRTGGRSPLPRSAEFPEPGRLRTVLTR